MLIMLPSSKMRLCKHPSAQFWRRLRHTLAANTSTAPISAKEQPTAITKGSGKKELIVNTKYDKYSDPMYQHLVYSTEVDVFLTAKRGKVWLERLYARNMAAEREQRERQMAARSQSVPVALQYLYGGAAQVQGEHTHIEQEFIEGTSIPDLSEIQPQQPEERLRQDDNILRNDHPVPVQQAMLPYQVCSNPSQSELQVVGDSQPRRRRGRGSRLRGASKQLPLSSVPTNAVDLPDTDSAEFDIIRDDLSDPEIRRQFSDDHLFKYGTPNRQVVPPVATACSGCGATLHCCDEKIPGYIPSQLVENKDVTTIEQTLCQRCYFIKEYNIALKVSVSPDDYPKTIEHIHDKSALVILVVDLLDFPGSVWPNILNLLGKNKKIILVGNKLDLILPDQSGYIKNITSILQEEFLKKCFENEADKVFPYLISAMCVSAKTGFNMERLIDKIFEYWRWNNNSLPGDIYLIGCTNVGKSSIFNTLLESDLCKVRAMDIVSKATTSPVPGTTLNLLKFPVTRPEPQFINDRRIRVKEADMAFSKNEIERLDNLRTSKSLEYITQSSYSITHTLRNTLRDLQPVSGYMDNTELLDQSKKDPDLERKREQFSMSKYCYDTPGTVSTDQIINLLTAEEVCTAVPVAPLLPRTLLLRVGQSLLLGGLGRLDFVEGLPMPPIRATVFCSQDLPVNIVETEGVDEFLANGPTTGLVGVPHGDNARLEKLPRLVGKEVHLKGAGEKFGASDIVLSSCGWVMLSARRDMTYTFIAYTPAGKGICVRRPYLPLSVNQRGRRVQGSPSYRRPRPCLDLII